MRRSALLLLGGVLLAASPSLALTWHIEADGTGDAPTIQAGIDLAAAGDTVEVAGGVYHDCTHPDYFGALNCIVMKPGIVLRSADGDPASVTIDPQGLGRGLTLVTAHEPTVIEGLTFTGGHVIDHDGGGMLLFGVDEAVEVRRCVFRENRTEGGSGGGLAAYTTDARFEDCEFLANSAPDAGLYSGGGGVYGRVSGMTFLRCRFADNEANVGAGLHAVTAIFRTLAISSCAFEGNEASFRAGGVFLMSVRCEISDTSFENNSGPSGAGALAAFRSEVDLQSCRFVGNSGGLGTGGALQVGDDNQTTVTACLFDGSSGFRGGVLSTLSLSTTSFTSCTFVDSHADAGGSLAYVHADGEVELAQCLVVDSGPAEVVTCTESAGGVSLTCSDVFGSAAGDWTGCLAGQENASGNFSEDPRFCDAGGGDYRLQWGSPCLPANSNGCGLVGRYGFGGCSSVSVAPESWGRIKARYSGVEIGR